MIDVQKLEMEILTRTELELLEHRIGYARAKLDQDDHNIVENTVPRARLKKLLSDYNKTWNNKKFKVTVPLTVEISAGKSDDFDGDIGLDWDGEQLYNKLDDKKVFAACPAAKDYIKKLHALEKSIEKEVGSICKKYHLSDDVVWDYIYNYED